MSTTKTAGLDRDSLERIAEVFKLFADATRLSILQALKGGSRTVGELVDELGTTQANISKHLGILHKAGLLAREKRGMQVHYSIDDEMIFPLCELVCGKLNREAHAASEFNFQI